jgi:hypothetical protein
MPLPRSPTGQTEGKKIHTEITYKFDGKDYDYKGAPDANSTRVYTRVDDHHYTYATKVNGLITTTSRVAVTPDGKTRTITTTGRDAQGRVIGTSASGTGLVSAYLRVRLRIRGCAEASAYASITRTYSLTNMGG